MSEEKTSKSGGDSYSGSTDWPTIDELKSLMDGILFTFIYLFFRA
jgi:hypothetical protein